MRTLTLPFEFHSVGNGQGYDSNAFIDWAYDVLTRSCDAEQCSALISIFRDNIDEHGEKLDTGTPVLIADYLDGLLDKLADDDVVFDARRRNVLAVAAALADEESPNRFHGNNHNGEIFSGSFMLGYQALCAGGITKDDFFMMLISALIHDYGHDGIDNGGEQYRLEKLAITMAMPRLRGAGLTSEEAAYFSAIVHATDPHSIDGQPSPSQRLRAYISDHAEDLPEELQDLSTPVRAQVAQMVQDVDVYFQLCGLEMTLDNAHRFADEMGDYKIASVEGVEFFKMHILGSGPASDWGKSLLGPWYNEFMRTDIAPDAFDQ